MKSERSNDVILVGINGSAGSASRVDPEGDFHPNKENSRSTVSVHNCCYQVKVSSKPCCGAKKPKTILNNINGIFPPGMNAILGPTGSGKTSMLDLMAGRKDTTGLSGDVLFNGCPPPSNFKCMVGYVVQDDVVMGTLTVRENLEFSAALRLPADTPKKERTLRVNQVVDELGLAGCVDSKVGDEFVRGISGGERKRTNIGMELIISPPVLFLDEPTTGLDASTANVVLSFLRRLATEGRTVIFSIHQPRYSIFKLFDSIMLLNKGSLVYHGPAAESLTYFSSIGYTCEEHNNPPDFFLDVINGDYDLDSNEKRNTKTGDTTNNTLAVKFKQSPWHKKLMSRVEPVYDDYKQKRDSHTLQGLERVEYATSFFTQLKVVSGRTVKNILRNPHTLISQFLVMALFALIMGTFYFDINGSSNTGRTAIQNRVGAFLFIIMNQVFGNLSAVDLFLRERVIFIHENVSGFYRVSSYFLAKVFCDVIPMRLVPVFIFCCIAYFMIGLRSGTEYFFFLALDLFLVTLSAASMSFAVSASVQSVAMANMLIEFVFVLMMLFSGLLINILSIFVWLRWLKWFSIFRYSMEGLEINQLSGMVFCDRGTNSSIPGANCTSGNQYLDEQGIEYGTAWFQWRSQMALGVMSLIFTILAYIQLVRLKKLK